MDLERADVEAAQRLGNGRDLPVVYLTDRADPEMLRRAWGTRSFGYLAKPVGTEQLYLSVESALSLHRRERKSVETKRGLEQRIEQVRSRESLMSTILNNLADGVVVADGNGDYIFANGRVERALGGSIPDTELDQRPTEFGLFRPDGKTPLPLAEMPIPRALRGEETDTEIFVRNRWVPKGMHVSFSGRPAKFDDGSNGAVVIYRDITRLKETEANLQKTSRSLEDKAGLLTTVLNSMSEGVIVVSEEGRLVHINASGKRIVGQHLLCVDPKEWSGATGIFHVDGQTPVKREEQPIVRAPLASRPRSTSSSFSTSRDRMAFTSASPQCRCQSLTTGKPSGPSQ